MKDKHVCIVGGGIGGMMSALILTHKGYRVTIIEKSAHLGGRLTYRTNGTYKIDRGPTVMLLPHLHREIFAQAGLDFDELLIERCDPTTIMQFHNGTHFVKMSDCQLQKAYFARHYPEDFVGFEYYLEDMQNLYRRSEAHLLTRPLPSIKSICNKEVLQILKDMQLYRSTRSFLKNYFTNNQLLDAYSLQTLYVGGGPTLAPSLYSLIGFSEHEHGVWYVHGGYASLTDYLVNKLEQRNVRIIYEETVIGVEKMGSTVSKVNTNNQQIPCDAVIFNTEYPLIADLLERRSKKYEPSNGCVTIYLGINRQYLQKPVHSFYLPENFDILFANLFKKQQLPEEVAIYVFNPSVIDDTLAPSGHSSLYVLVPVPSQTQQINWDDVVFLQAFVHQVMQILENDAGFSGICDAIQWQEILTPADCEREGLYLGGSFGIAPHLWQSGPFRPQAKIPKLSNAYAVGASVHPGGGIPIVMQSAKFACEEIQRGDMNDNTRSI